MSLAKYSQHSAAHASSATLCRAAMVCLPRLPSSIARGTGFALCNICMDVSIRLVPPLNPFTSSRNSACEFRTTRMHARLSRKCLLFQPTKLLHHRERMMILRQLTKSQHQLMQQTPTHRESILVRTLQLLQPIEFIDDVSLHYEIWRSDKMHRSPSIEYNNSRKQ